MSSVLNYRDSVNHSASAPVPAPTSAKKAERVETPTADAREDGKTVDSETTAEAEENADRDDEEDAEIQAQLDPETEALLERLSKLVFEEKIDVVEISKRAKSLSREDFMASLPAPIQSAYRELFQKMEETEKGWDDEEEAPPAEKGKSE